VRNKYRTWTYGLLYTEDGPILECYNKRDSAEMLEQFMTWRPVDWLLMHLPFGFLLWNKGVLWCSAQTRTVLQIPLSEGQFKLLAPDDEYGWWKESDGHPLDSGIDN
jgi:hypothetical protein